MFIAAPFTIARIWKQPRCSLADEWIKKLWYIYTMEYYSAIKRNILESVLMRWMKLEPIIQSEVSQKVKCKYCMKVKVTQSYLTLCNPMDYTVPGILQARILELVAFAFSRDLLNPGIESGSPALQVNSLSVEPQEYCSG